MNAYRRLMVAWCAAALAIIPLLETSRAQAQTEFAQKAAAEALFQEGAKLLEAGDTERACAKFDASQQLEPGIGTTLRLADCLDRLGKTASAWATFQQAAAMARAQGQGERVDIALQRATDLESRLSRVALVVSPETRELPGLKVLLNGVVVPEGTWGSAVPVDPGLQQIEVKAVGYRPHTIEVRVEKPGTRVEVEVPRLQLQPEVPPEATGDASEPREPRASAAALAPSQPSSQDASPVTDPGRAHRIAAYVTGAAGLAALGVGGYFTYRAYDLNQQSLSHCIAGEPNSCSRRGKSLRDDARSAGTLATIVSAAGGTAVAASVVLFVIAPRQENVPPMQLSAHASSGAAALQLEGAW